jgi:hypothetical protein
MQHRSFGTRNSLPGGAIHGGALRQAQHGHFDKLSTGRRARATFRFAARKERAGESRAVAKSVSRRQCGSTLDVLQSALWRTRPPWVSDFGRFWKVVSTNSARRGPVRLARGGPVRRGQEPRVGNASYCAQQFQIRGICCMKGFPGAPGSQGSGFRVQRKAGMNGINRMGSGGITSVDAGATMLKSFGPADRKYSTADGADGPDMKQKRDVLEGGQQERR